MFKTKSDAAEYARGHTAIFDKIWNPETQWTEDFLEENRAKDVQYVLQGQTCNGIKGMLKQWTPKRGVFVQHKTLGVDIETFTENMVAFKHYRVFKTFENRELFIVNRGILNVNIEGKVEQEVYFMDQKYWDAMKGVMGAFAEKNGNENWIKEYLID